MSRAFLILLVSMMVVVGGSCASKPAPSANAVASHARDVDAAMKAFLDSDLPKDIPVPDHTPFDSNPAERASYLDAYRDGFAGSLMNIVQTRCFAPEPIAQGYSDGEEAGRKLYGLRQEAQLARRFASVQPGTRPITDDSPAAERALRDDFAAFVDRLLVNLRAAYPRTLSVRREKRSKSVYRFTWADYSASNASEPVMRQLCGAVLSFEVAASDAAAKLDADERELLGSYSLQFEHTDGRWTNVEWDDFHHLREVNRSPDGRSYQLEPAHSALADRLVGEALERASTSPQP